MYSDPFMRTFWLPTLLSPIPEDEESAPWKKLNNDSTEMPNYDRIRSRGSIIGADGVLSNQNQSAPRPLDLERKIIESHSGRKLDSVEVLKQKYLNDDIQDIPRIIQGPLRYGRLHRSRSHINLSSQDIRSQINKIRLRMGAIQCGDEDSKLIKSDYRCSRLKDYTPSPAVRTNSIEQLLYGCPREDDYDPELAALFEDYVEVCDNPTRATPVVDYSLRDRYIMGRMLMESALNTETRKAFLSGFLEGIYHTPPDEIEALDRVIENTEIDPKESPKDPCINQTSHLDLIKNNQDITHKFLKEWEQTNNRQDQEENTCFACHRQKVSENNATLKQTDGNMSDIDKTGLLMDDKPIKKRSLLPLGKTELDLAVPVTTKIPLKTGRSGNNTRKPVLKKVPRTHKPGLTTTPKIPAIQTKKLAPSTTNQHLSESQTPIVGKGGDASTPVFDEARDRGCYCDEKVSNRGDRNEQRSLEGTPFSELKSPCEMQNKGNIWSETPDIFPLNASDFYHSQDNYETRSRRHRYANVDTSEDVSIISLAKQKLENKHMSSTMLEDWFRRKQEQKQMGTDVNRIKKEDVKSTGKTKSKPAVDSPDLGDLDGWETDTTHLNDVINLHVSSSELLHPVDSTEKFSPAVQTPIENKDSSKNVDDSGIKVGRKSTQGRETPTSAKLSDLEDQSCRKGSFETKAFKHRSTFTNDLKKATSLVKLRLTKSCANVPANGGLNDRAFANVPLATCSNYHVNTTLISNLKTKPAVNLSTRLAKRIRNIGRDDNRSEDAQQHGNSSQGLPVKSEKSKTANGSRIFPIIEHEFNKERQSPCAVMDKITLPEIRHSPNNEDQENMALPSEAKRTCQQGKCRSEPVTGNQAKSTSVDLPPISVKSYQRNCTSPNVTNTPRIANTDWHFNGQDTFGTGSVAVRAEVCTSPYEFDKCDPNKLVVNARSVPNHHTVCMSCGGISEKITHPSSTSKEERRVHKSTDKFIHDHCRSPVNDGKWKLNRTYSDHNREAPKMNSNNLPDNRYPQRIKKQRSEEKPSYASISTSKQVKPRNDGMTFNFMGQNIKLKFECEVNVGGNEEDKISANNSDRCKRLQDIAKPTFRDKLRNPMSRETGVYGTKRKNGDLSGFRDSLNSPNRESPYVEYCKRKAIMRCRKLQEIEHELAKITTDIDSDIVAESPRTSRKFPVLPGKKQSDKEMAQTNKNSCRKGRKETKHATSTVCQDLVVKSDRLPLLKSETRCKAEKRIGKQRSTESFQDELDAAMKANALEVYVQTCEMLD